MDCRAGCRARFQELHPPHRYGHLPQPLSEGVHPSGYQHLLPARLRHRRSYWRRHGTRLEPELAASADLVLANSTRFAAELQAYNPHTYPIETGVNLTLYNPAKEYGTPDDVQNIPHPIIGYMGTINSTRLDGELLYQIISQRPDYSFVFTGPEDDGFRQHRIHSLKNAYFTGQKKWTSCPLTSQPTMSASIRKW